MRFYNRETELEELRLAYALSKTTAQFTVVTGRRRIGKTKLIREAYKYDTMLYFFVSRKSEKELCQGFKKEIEQKLNIPLLGEITHFHEIFEFLLKLSVNENFTLFIDEFQEFYRVNPSVFGDMQRLWDEYQDSSKINLIVCGSIYNMMTKIFRDSKEPLYNRENRFMIVKPFKIRVLKEILKDYHKDYSPEDLLALYTFTGGVAKYVQILMERGATSKNEMINGMINPNSPFLGEGKALLIEEFGKEYGIYFSILSAISIGKNSRSEIENAVGKEIGGYLSRLEDEYEIINKINPIFEKNHQKNVRYVIKDNFLQFWFRFIFRYQYMIEIDAYDSLKQIIERDYETYSGKILEKYFRQFMSEQGEITRIGAWWDRKGHNEIDIIAENELNKTLLIGEVKRNIKNYNERELRERGLAFFNSVGNFRGYDIIYRDFSLEDM
ncbi:MAG: ATP-binding protein [Muribaculaceae bacterium]|nr:ATP-binding protein [Muribaculaceae bacterium]